METLNLNLKDYSPVELSAEQEAVLEKVFGPRDETQLIDRFCRVIQEELNNIRKNSEGKQPVEILRYLFPDRNKKEQELKLFEKYGGGWQTGGCVGAIRLVLKKNKDIISEDLDVTIRIRSRFDGDGEPRFLRYVLEKAFELPSEETKSVVYEDMAVENILNTVFDLLLLHLFFRQLRGALKRGMYRQYQEFSHNDPNVRGRIDISRHIRENPLPNGKICYVTREYTVNNAVNQLILEAAKCLERKYRSAYRELLKGNDLCAKGLATLKGELFDAPPASLRQVIRNAGKKIVHSVYRDYEPLRKTCIAILRRAGADSFKSDKAGNNGVAGLLVDMPTLWEIFLYNTVFRELVGSQNGYKQKEYDILGGKRSVKPDFLLFENSPYEKRIVLDAKYKKSWRKAYERACHGFDWEEREDDSNEPGDWKRRDADKIRKDLFQVIAYMHLFRCKTGGVIFPFRCDKPLLKKSVNGPDLEFELYAKLPDDKFLLIPYFIPAQGEENFNSIIEQNNERIREFLNDVNAHRSPAPS